MRLADLPRPRSLLAPFLHEGAVLAELDHAVVLAVAVAVGHEDVAVRSDDDVGRLIEEVRPRSADARLAKRHQHLALWAELEYLVPLARFSARVGHPQVAVAIDGGAVREDEHALTPRLEQLAVLVVLQDRRLAAAGAGVGEAAMNHIDGSVGCRLHRRHGRP